MMTGYLFVAVAVLLAVAGLRVRHRLRHQPPPALSGWAGRREGC